MWPGRLACTADLHSRDLQGVILYCILLLHIRLSMSKLDSAQKSTCMWNRRQGS